MNTNSERLDDQIEGQMSLDDYFGKTEPQEVFAISRIFERARKEMNLAEQKAFVFALSHLRFTEKAPSNIISVNKGKLTEILGINAGTDHKSQNLYRAIKNMPGHSQIEILKEDQEKYGYKSGIVVEEVTVDYTNLVKIEIREKYMSLFTELLKEDKSNAGYLTMWASDIFGMKSERSVEFYGKLRAKTDSRLEINSSIFGVKTLKEIFKIPKSGKGSYVRAKDGFDRSNFEKKVIDPICEDLKKTKMIQLLMQPDGKYYEKVKNGKSVSGYRFFWTFSQYPAVMISEDVKQIIEKKPKKARETKEQPRQQNRFNNFQQRNYDDDLLKQLERTQPK